MSTEIVPLMKSLTVTLRLAVSATVCVKSLFSTALHKPGMDEANVPQSSADIINPFLVGRISPPFCKQRKFAEGGVIDHSATAQHCGKHHKAGVPEKRTHESIIVVIAEVDYNPVCADSNSQ